MHTISNSSFGCGRWEGKVISYGNAKKTYEKVQCMYVCMHARMVQAIIILTHTACKNSTIYKKFSAYSELYHIHVHVTIWQTKYYVTLPHKFYAMVLAVRSELKTLPTFSMGGLGGFFLLLAVRGAPFCLTIPWSIWRSSSFLRIEKPLLSSKDSTLQPQHHHSTTLTQLTHISLAANTCTVHVHAVCLQVIFILFLKWNQFRSWTINNLQKSTTCMYVHVCTVC